MTTSKHVLEIFDLLRSSQHITCVKGGKAEEQINILRIDTYPEDGEENIIFLANGKKISVYDLEFAEPKDGNIVLGDYTFIL